MTFTQRIEDYHYGLRHKLKRRDQQPIRWKITVLMQTELGGWAQKFKEIQDAGLLILGENFRAFVTRRWLRMADMLGP